MEPIPPSIWTLPTSPHHDGDPIVGEVLEREGVRSGRWRFVEVKWLD